MNIARASVSSFGGLRDLQLRHRTHLRVGRHEPLHGDVNCRLPDAEGKTQFSNRPSSRGANTDSTRKRPKPPLGVSCARHQSLRARPGCSLRDHIAAGRPSGGNARSGHGRNVLLRCAVPPLNISSTGASGRLNGRWAEPEPRFPLSAPQRDWSLNGASVFQVPPLASSVSLPAAEASEAVDRPAVRGRPSRNTQENRP
jgi:hypothetical protein